MVDNAGDKVNAGVGEMMLEETAEDQ